MPRDDEVSPSGAPIYRHEERARDWKTPQHAGRNLQDVEAHVEKYIGPVETVFHEIASDAIHLDVLFVRATDARPYHVLVTSGMSDLPMNVPRGAEAFERAELLMALPGQWPLSPEAFENEASYWPVRWLKQIGRLPHDYDTWIGWGHTIPNGDPPAKIADTDFIGVMVTPAYWLDEDFFQLEAASGDVVTFYDLIPLYAEEMELKLEKGADALEARLDDAAAWGTLDVSRRNVAR